MRNNIEFPEQLEDISVDVTPAIIQRLQMLLISNPTKINALKINYKINDNSDFLVALPMGTIIKEFALKFQTTAVTSVKCINSITEMMSVMTNLTSLNFAIIDYHEILNELSLTKISVSLSKLTRLKVLKFAVKTGDPIIQYEKSEDFDKFASFVKHLVNLEDIELQYYILISEESRRKLVKTLVSMRQLKSVFVDLCGGMAYSTYRQVTRNQLPTF